MLVAIPGLNKNASGASEEELFSGVTTIIAPYQEHSDVRIDGTISQDEYDSNLTFTASDTGVSISILHDNDSLFVGIEGPAWSWVALGVSSDGAATMGFVIVAREQYGFSVHEAMATSVSEDITFSGPPSGVPTVENFEARILGEDHAGAEIQLALKSSLWSLEPGVVYPTVFGSNLTAPAAVPGGISADEAHFVGSYFLRPVDNARNVNEMLNGKTSPTPSVVALAVLALGVVAIFTEFVVRRRKE